VVRDAGGSTWIERAGLVVGADGRNSLVAARAGAPTLAAGGHAAAYAYGYWPSEGLDGYHWYYGDGLSAGVIPTNGGNACIFVAGPPAVLATATRGRRPAAAQRWLIGQLDHRLADRVAAPPEGSVRIFRGLPARLRSAYGPGWVLAGDAGWWKDPLSTHGITDALRDAEALAAAVVSGSVSERATAMALAGYQVQRDRVALAMHPIVDRLASHEWDLPEARRLLLGLSSVMANEVDALEDLDRVAARIA
jgi:2-polyprenyl-6-methoxyphenol hydroxylase-like FAD-dependent oxidoreductase